MTGASRPWVGARLQPVEGERFVTGSGRFVADVRLPGLLEVVFVRSMHGHARIRGVDVSRAAGHPDVVAVLTGEDVQALARPLRARWLVPGFKETDYPVLALGKVRFVGQPLAAVAASDRAVAEDAAATVVVDYDPLPAVTDPELALAPGAPLLHEEVGSNVLFRTELRAGEIDDAFRSADLVLSEVFRHSRQTGVPLECRGSVASYDARDQVLTLWTSTQIPHLLRSALAAALGMPEHRLRVVAPDVGGGFGIKAHLFPEEVVVCLLARRLGRPIRWIEERAEHLQASAHAREQVHVVDVAARRDGVVLGIRDRIISDAGAYSGVPWGAAQEAAAAVRSFPGPYKVSAFQCESLAVATNKCPLGPYRGVARPGTTFVIEAVMDRLARALGLDPSEVRRRNLVQPGEFPYRAVTGFVLDSGSHVESLEKALAAAGYSEWRRRQGELRAVGRYLGVGISCYAEASAWGSVDYNRRGVVGLVGYERAVVTMEPSGHVTLRVGVSSQGQSLETTLAQVVADELGVAPGDVRVIHGDTDRCPYGSGTFASRSAVAAGGSAMLAARELREKLLEIAAHMLEANVEDLVLEYRRVSVRGARDRGVALGEIANLAYFWPSKLPPGLPSGLESRAHYDPPAATFSHGCHVAVVEVDPETGSVRVVRYVVAEDCGPMINPLVVDGQVHGGVAQGIGGALYERIAYDGAGQLLTATLMEYSLPRASDLPEIEVSHLETPSPFTPGGRKGMGEGGTIGAHAAIANALADALEPLGVRINELPLTPEVVWRSISGARADHARGEPLAIGETASAR